MLALEFDPHVSSKRTAQELVLCMSEVHREVNDLLKTENESLISSLLNAALRLREMCYSVYVTAMFSEVRNIYNYSS